MDTTIIARHCTVPDSLRNQAQQRIARLARLDRRLTAATIVFDVDSSRRLVESRVAVAGGPPLVGTGEGATMRGALDASLHRLERQTKRRRERSIARRKHGAAREGALTEL